jgi:hypothetical protein
VIESVGAQYNARVKRFQQLLFTAFAALSLLACTGTVYLWVRGHLVYDRYQWSDIRDGNKWRTWVADSVDGELFFARAGVDFDTNAHAAVYFRGYPSQRGFQHETRQLSPSDKIWNFGDRWFNRLGFVGSADTFRPASNSPSIGSVHRFLIPCWFGVIVTAAPVAIWIGRFTKARKRHMEGLCKSCGYDLRATPERCPECGAVPVGKEIVSS